MSWTTPRTWVAAETLTAALLNTHLRDNWNAAFPVGSTHWRMQAETSVETLVDGFGLEANGYAVSRTTYSALQTKMSGLGYPFGAGNGSTTMNLPDLRGRMPVMCGSHGDVDLGDSDGVSEANRTPKHNSSDSFSIASGGSHTHGYARRTTGSASSVGSTGSVGWGAEGSGTTDSGGSHTHSMSGSVGPGGTRPIDMPAYLTIGIIVVKH